MITYLILSGIASVVILLFLEKIYVGYVTVGVAIFWGVVGFIPGANIVAMLSYAVNVISNRKIFSKKLF